MLSSWVCDSALLADGLRRLIFLLLYIVRCVAKNLWISTVGFSVLQQLHRNFPSKSSITGLKAYICANAFHVPLTTVRASFSSRKYFAYFISVFFSYYWSEPNVLLLILKLLHFQWHLTKYFPFCSYLQVICSS